MLTYELYDYHVHFCLILPRTEIFKSQTDASFDCFKTHLFSQRY